jgi:hypothetical protein
LGVATGLDATLLNAPNDDVNFVVSDGGSFKIFAADYLNAMYLNGVMFTVTANFSDGTSASASTVIGVKPTLSLAFDGQIRDRVGQAEFAAFSDGLLDGVFTVSLNAGSGNRTLTRLFLTNVPGGIWDTQPSDTFWTLGVAAGFDTALLNGADDSITLPLPDGASFKVFAADYHNAMYLHGVVFTLTANFSDGSSATASAIIP